MLKAQNLTTRTRSLTTKGIPLYDKIAQAISEIGWSPMCVLPDPDERTGSLPFIYSIGNCECGLPELLMIGCAYEGGSSLLNTIIARMRHYNRAFTDGESIDLGKKLQPKAFWANEEAKEYTVQVGEYYGTNDYAVQQIVAPDTLGRYPEDPQCDLPFRLVPLLRNNTKH
jgi:Domain of unknown function (DUF4262)